MLHTHSVDSKHLNNSDLIARVKPQLAVSKTRGANSDHFP